MESGEVIKLGGIDDAAKRRTVQLVNPSLTNKKATSRTLQMSIQLVKPGERAECHRHTAAALRFIVEGDGTGYTNVEGEADVDGARRSRADAELDLARSFQCREK